MRGDIFQFSNMIEESKVSFGLTNTLEKRLSSNEDSSLNDKDNQNDEWNEGPVGPGFKDTSLDRIARFAAKALT